MAHMRSVAVSILMGGFALGSVAFSQTTLAENSGSNKDDKEAIADNLTPSVNLAPALPPAPAGKTTVIGGAVRSVDRLRDLLTINIYGGHVMKIYFDERTEIYRDGQRVSLNDLKPGERISIETLLDGEDIFARSVHMLTQTLDGECHGQVLGFDRSTGVLSIRDGLAPDPIRVRVPAGVPITGEGQQSASAANLAPGALVSLTFQSDGSGHAVARQISILATPGSSFVFTGKIDFLDLRSGLLVVVDPRDQKKYEVSFDPRMPVRQSLREGVGVTVTAGFDGSRYSASTIQVNSPSTR